MTNPVKTVTNQARKLRLRMILMYAILAVLISVMLNLLMSLSLLLIWLVSSLFVEHYEQTFLMQKFMKFGSEIEDWAWALWEFMSGFSKETTDMK